MGHHMQTRTGRAMPPPRCHRSCRLTWATERTQWVPERGASLATFAGHEAPVYNALWSPHSPDVFASASADCTFRVRARALS